MLVLDYVGIQTTWMAAVLLSIPLFFFVRVRTTSVRLNDPKRNSDFMNFVASQHFGTKTIKEKNRIQKDI